MLPRISANQRPKLSPPVAAVEGFGFGIDVTFAGGIEGGVAPLAGTTAAT